MKSRERFISKVANVIDENHAKHKDSFIFGISGKWGEGKTTFLEGLEKDLKEKGFIIVWISAWKYGTDKTALLRNFLFELKDTLKVPDNNKFSMLSHDVSESKIDWMKTLCFVLLMLFAILVYGDLQSRYPLNPLMILFVSSILLPIGLAAAKSVTTLQMSSRSISTMDKFDELLKYILQKESSNQRIVVFVDDLDRVSPSIARDVLDNLRTFFDEQKLSYVVTADHTVLERHIGNAVLSDGEPSEKLFEGRRFLKKVFNYYWRLPLPVDPEFKIFLDNIFTGSEEKLKKVFPIVESNKIFKSYLSKFFGKNPREVLRFIETVLFTFEIIGIQEEESDEENKIYYKSMQENPLLVVRVLMIQELCPSFFEEIIQDNVIFGDMELAVAEGDSKKLESILDKYEKKISTAQKNFLIRFLHEKPRFHGTNAAHSLLVPDYRPFINLAADASFGDSRGPEPEAFITLLKAGSVKDIQETLDATSKTQLEKAAKATIAVFADTTIETKEKFLHLANLLKSLNSVKNSAGCYPPFFASLKDVDFEFISDSSIDRNQRDTAIIEMWKWLDLYEEDDDFQKYFDIFTFLGEGELELIISKMKNAGWFSTNIIIDDWFKKLFKKDKSSALRKLHQLETDLNSSVVAEYLSDNEFHGSLVEEFTRTSEMDIRDAIFDLTKKYNPAKLKDFVTVGLSLIRGLDEKFWEWLEAREDEEWKKDKLEQQIIDALDDVDQPGTLDAVLQYASGRVQNSLSAFWKKIIAQHSASLLMALKMSIGYPAMHEKAAPTITEAKELFKIMVEVICEISDPTEMQQGLQVLKKEYWPWKNLISPDGNKIKKLKSLMKKNENELVQQAVQQVFQSWGIKTEGE